ncbi:restriction endonuclease subunit S [Staphylococcus xylosus]|uniref:restriction endonuclease subunit S n=1 Tax=Staphylococcus xylosus TaxID=1288 RepID=UPI003F54D74D
MTNQEKKVPELRFPEFDGEWEEKTIGKIATTFSGGTPSSTNRSYYNGEIPFIRSGEISKSSTELMINKEAISNSSAKMVEKGDLLYALYGATSGEVAISKISGAINQAVLCIRSQESATYIFNYLKMKKDQILKTYIQGGQGNLSASIIKKVDINLPYIEEQEKIGTFFSKLDRQIELEEQKLAKLEEQKKGYMQQIFSQKLRFKDENGSDYPNWEEVQLKDILIRRDHKQVPEINAPLMSFTSTGGIEPKGDRYNREFLVKNKNKKYKRTEFNDLIYSSNNLDVGAIGLNRYGTSVISDVYEIFKIEEQVSPYFIEMSILQPEFMYKILRYRQGALYGQYRIHANDFLKINIELPCSEEQYKIGDFVNKLDNIIDIINNKIELLKQRKRGFLQKMFI